MMWEAKEATTVTVKDASGKTVTLEGVGLVDFTVERVSAVAGFKGRLGKFNYDLYGGYAGACLLSHVQRRL